MALQTTAVVRQLMGSNHVGTPTDTTATVALQQRNGVICVIRPEVLYAGRFRERPITLTMKRSLHFEICVCLGKNTVLLYESRGD